MKRLLLFVFLFSSLAHSQGVVSGNAVAPGVTSSSGQVYTSGGTSAVPTFSNSPGLGTAGCLTITATNEGVTGTTVNRLAKIVNDPQVAKVLATTDTLVGIGIVTTGAGTTSSATICTVGTASCDFDNSATANHYFVASTSAGGKCHDAGATIPTAVMVWGVVNETGAAGVRSVTMGLGDTANATAQIGNGKNAGTIGTVTSVTTTVPSQMTATNCVITTSGTCAITLNAPQGNGSKLQLSTGSTTTNDIVIYDSNGNTASSGVQISAAAVRNCQQGSTLTKRAQPLGGWFRQALTSNTEYLLGGNAYTATNFTAQVPLATGGCIVNPTVNLSNGTVVAGAVVQFQLHKPSNAGVNTAYDPNVITGPMQTANTVYSNSTTRFRVEQTDPISIHTGTQAGTMANINGYSYGFITDSAYALMFIADATTNAGTGGAAKYYCFWCATLGGASLASTTEADTYMVMATGGTAGPGFSLNLGTQPGTGTSVWTVRKDTACGGSPASQAITVTQAVSTTGLYHDLANTFAYSAGDCINMLEVNNASTTSGALNGASLVLQPTGGAGVGMIGAVIGATITAGAAARYFPPMINENGATETSQRWPLPLSPGETMTIGPCYVNIKTAGASSNVLTVTVMKSASGSSSETASSIVGTINAGTSGPVLINLTDTFTYPATTEFKFSSVTGAGPVVQSMSCKTS